MAATRTNYTSDVFVVSAGCLLFRLVDGVDLQLCILYNARRGIWVLPKGRKDCGESIEAAALRETFEETGYSCEFLPCTLETRAPLPGVDLHPSQVLTVERATEPFVVTTQQMKNGLQQQDREVAAKARQIVEDTAKQGEGVVGLFQSNDQMLDVRG